MNPVKNLKKTIPPRVRFMLALTGGVVIVGTLAIMNMMSSDNAKPAERGTVNVNLNPSEQDIGRSLPGDASILPPESDIALAIDEQMSLARTRAMDGDASFSEGIKIPSSTESPPPQDLNANAVRDLIENKRTSEQNARAGTQATGAAIQNSSTAAVRATFDRAAFMEAELNGAREDNSLVVAIENIASREQQVRPQGSAEVGAVRLGGIDDGEVFTTNVVNNNTVADEYIDGFARASNSPVSGTVADRLENYRQRLGQSTGGSSGVVSQTNAASNSPVVFNDLPATNGRVLPAGTILYAVLDTGVNSDNTTIVRATILQEGPFKGAHLLGQVQQKGDKVTLQFNRMGLKQRDFAVSAVAVDPDTVQTALADGVDNHLLQRYGMLWGSAFLEGFANALGNTVTVVNTDGSQVTTRGSIPDSSDQTLIALGKVGERTAPMMASQFARQPTIHVSEGRPIGVMLMEGLPY